MSHTSIKGSRDYTNKSKPKTTNYYKMLSARSNASAAAGASVKITYQGDTKKVKLTGEYEELVQRTRASFDDLPEGDLKFFYVDEDSDLISVTSQADLSEALESTGQVKLTVAGSNNEALGQIVGTDAKAQILAPEATDAVSELVPEDEPAEYEDFSIVGANEAVADKEEGQPLEKSSFEGNDAFEGDDERVPLAEEPFPITEAYI